MRTCCHTYKWISKRGRVGKAPDCPRLGRRRQRDYTRKKSDENKNFAGAQNKRELKNCLRAVLRAPGSAAARHATMRYWELRTAPVYSHSKETPCRAASLGPPCPSWSSSSIPTSPSSPRQESSRGWAVPSR